MLDAGHGVNGIAHDLTRLFCTILGAADERSRLLGAKGGVLDRGGDLLECCGSLLDGSGLLFGAAGEIVGTELAVSEIAKRSGYPNLQSFNRIFKSVYGMPPARYRREGSHTAYEPSPNGKTKVMLDVTIREIAPIELIGVAHTGSYMQIDKAFETLFGTLYARGLAKPDMRMIGVYLDDPDIVPEEKLRSIACV
ncbi:GyrI-like domain-containing protein, partial [Rhizobium ruizarguesonis]